jgi:hypothetical protein
LGGGSIQNAQKSLGSKDPSYIRVAEATQDETAGKEKGRGGD